MEFEDFSQQAAWLSTEGECNEVAWDVPPTILQSIPHDPNMPLFLKIDLFHVLQMGVYKEFVASSLCVILPVLAQTSQEGMLALNCKLQQYLKATKQRLHCCDSTVLMGFLEWLFQNVGVDFEGQRPFKYVYAGATAIHSFMRLLFEEGAFLPNSVAIEAAMKAQRFLLCYGKLAEFAVQNNRLLFNLVPKLHYLHHVSNDLFKGALHRRLAHVANPLTNSTSQCEDFIGHIARLSRRVSPRQVHARVIRRYLAAVADHLGLLQ